MFQERIEPLTSEDIPKIKASESAHRILWTFVFCIILIFAAVYSYAYESWALISISTIVLLFLYLMMRTNNKYEEIIGQGNKMVITGIITEIYRHDYGKSSEGTPKCYLRFAKDLELCIDKSSDEMHNFLKKGAFVEIAFVEIARPNPHATNKYRGENVILGIKELNDENDKNR